MPGGSWRTGESLVHGADGLQKMGRIDDVEVAVEPGTGGGEDVHRRNGRRAGRTGAMQTSNEHAGRVERCVQAQGDRRMGFRS